MGPNGRCSPWGRGWMTGGGDPSPVQRGKLRPHRSMRVDPGGVPGLPGIWELDLSWAQGSRRWTRPGSPHSSKGECHPASPPGNTGSPTRLCGVEWGGAPRDLGPSGPEPWGWATPPVPTPLCKDGAQRGRGRGGLLFMAPSESLVLWASFLLGFPDSGVCTDLLRRRDGVGGTEAASGRCPTPTAPDGRKRPRGPSGGLELGPESQPLPSQSLRF